MKTKSRLEEISLVRGIGYGYSVALFNHVAPIDEDGVRDYNFISAMSHFLWCYPEDVVDFLHSEGVDEIHEEYFQYVLGLLPPVYSPYWKLIGFISKSFEETGEMPSTGYPDWSKNKHLFRRVINSKGDR